MTTTAKPIRVLVVDDSALMRKLIPQILESDNSIHVVGTAIDGNFGLKKLEELKPQVVTLDLEMPGMGGLEMLKEIMRRHRVPVIVVSSHSTQGASVTLKALSLGAFDFVAKPADVSTRMQEVGRDLIAKFKELVNEGNVHRISLRTDEGKTLFEVPLTMGVAGAAAAIFIAPALAALGVIAALMKQVTVVVERIEE